MSVRILVNNTINDLTKSLDNNDMIYRIVQDLMGKISNTNIVTTANKNLINKYFTGLSHTHVSNISLSNQIDSVELKNIDNTPVKNLLLLTVLYYLSDLNKYDFHLINFGLEYGLSVKDLLVLLLMNDIHSIDVFCNSRNIFGSQYYTIATLKKLSALHKVEYNF